MFLKVSSHYVRFKVLTEASMMFRAVFWVVLPCKMIVDRRFRGAYCLHYQYNPEDSSEQVYNSTQSAVAIVKCRHSSRLLLLLTEDCQQAN
jgi:hypothetical protein